MSTRRQTVLQGLSNATAVLTWIAVAFGVFLVGAIVRAFLQNVTEGQEVGGAVVEAVLHTSSSVAWLPVLARVVVLLAPRVHEQWLIIRGTHATGPY
jgi:hypothetical protein